MTSNIFSAVIYQEQDLYVAECPEGGTVSQGTNVEEAITNLRETTSLYLEEFPQPKIGHPLLTTFEVALYA